MSETTVRAKDKGAIASWAAAGLGLITGHDYFNRGFLDALLNQHVQTLGMATMAGKVKLFLDANPGQHFHLETYLLLGDPALEFPNYPPVAEQVTPNSGASSEDVLQTFQAGYRDPDGWADLQYAYFLVSTTAAGGDGFYARFDVRANQLHVWDPVGSEWIGGYQPGQLETIVNANGKLYVGQCAISGAGETLSVTWAVSFGNPMAGSTYNQYLKAVDVLGLNSTWMQVGTWRVSHAPQVLSLTTESPFAKPWATQVFTATYSDLDGWQDIALAELLINLIPDSAYGLHVRYDSVANRMYLRDDGDTSWLGGCTPGSVGTIANGQATLSCAESAVSGSGTQLQVQWALTFEPWFIGWRRNAYLAATDLGRGGGGWEHAGVWKVK